MPMHPRDDRMIGLAERVAAARAAVAPARAPGSSDWNDIAPDFGNFPDLAVHGRIRWSDEPVHPVFTNFLDVGMGAEHRWSDAPDPHFLNFNDLQAVAPPPPDERDDRLLLVLQATSFCNLDCTYCYLPNRHEHQGLDREQLEVLARGLAGSAWLPSHVDILWHAGEPLATPRSKLDEAVRTLAAERIGARTVRHLVQTNATLVDDAWAAWLADEGFGVGVSIDGPADLHDASRRRRGGQPTWAATVRGIRTLQRHGIEPSAITVLTARSLTRATDILDTLASLGIRDVGFNVEEIEGAHHDSSLASPGLEHRVRSFYREVLGWTSRHPGAIRVREVERARAQISAGIQHPVSNANNRPMAILTVAHDGSFGTFSPELAADPTVRPLGRLGEDPLALLPSLVAGSSIAAEVDLGIERCRASCEHFAVCGGGAPSNKIAEHGTADSTQTIACRLGTIAPFEAVLADALERAGADLGVA